jgi:branched-subunit amino acid aminotransferase/4-amino-4-deoxychorismate lyase
MSIIWCNGEFLDPSSFHIAPTDRGLMHGLGLFETILALDGKPVFAERHLARLRQGCEKLRWSLDVPDLLAVMAELISTNGFTFGRSRIRLAVTGGSGLIGDLAAGDDRLVWMTAARAPDPPATTTANLSPFFHNERAALSGLKCSAYAENLVAMDHARRLGFEETVFSNSSGNLCEAATSNVFLVKGGKLLTPSLASGCLPGVTREVVIQLAGRLEIPCEETELPAALIREADEIFLTSSIRGVMGVSRFEQRELPAGPLTGKLRVAWNSEVHRECGG